MTDPRLNIKITADGQQAEGALSGIAQRVDAVGNHADSARSSVAGFAGAFEPLGKAALWANELGELFGTIGAGAGDLARMADQFAGLNGRLQIAVGEGQALAEAFAQVRAIANSTGSDIDATATLFGRLATATKDLGVSQQEVAKLTETINQSFTVSGASATAASNAITQLAQGLSAGALRGDEFNSVMEQAPRLAQALADHLGVSTGALRKLAEEGKLTAEVITQALTGQADAIAADFAKMPRTIGQAMQSAKNEFLVFVGELDKAKGVSAGVANAIDGLTAHIDELGSIATSVGAVAFAGMAAKIAAAFAESGVAIRKSILDMQAKQAADLQAAQASNTHAEAEKKSAIATLDATRARQAAAQAALLEAQATLKAAADVGLYGQQRATAERAVTAARTELTAATTALTAAERANMAATTQLTTAKAAATVQAGLLGKAFRALSLPTNIMLAVAGFQALTAAGEWLGNTIAEKVHGPIKGLDESMRTLPQQAQATKDAFNGVGTAAQTLAQQIDVAKVKLVDGFNTALADAEKKGLGAAEALKAMFKVADTTTPVGIKALADALAQLAAEGKLSAEQIRTSWSEAIKSLTGGELQAFVMNVKLAFAETEGGARQSAGIMDAVLRKAIADTGQDFDLLRTGMTRGFQDASSQLDLLIENLQGMKDAGIDASRAIEGGIINALKKVSNGTELEAMRQQLQAAGIEGDKAGAAVEKAFADAQKRIEDLTPGIQSVNEAFRALGMKTPEELRALAATAKEAFETIRRSGTAAPQQIEEAFLRYAKAAIAANGGVADSTLKAEAAALGLAVKTDAAGDAIVRASDASGGLADGMRQAAADAGAVAEEMERAGNALKNMRTDYSRAQLDAIASGKTPGGLMTPEAARNLLTEMDRQELEDEVNSVMESERKRLVREQAESIAGISSGRPPATAPATPERTVGIDLRVNGGQSLRMTGAPGVENQLLRALESAGAVARR